MKDLEKVQETLSETFDYLKDNNLQLIGEDLQAKVGDAHRIVENLIIQRVSQRSELLFDFLKHLESIEALKHTENFQLKTYVANYEAKL